MNAQQFMQVLNDLGACSGAKEWAVGKSWQEVYDTCHRGDWLLWLYRRSKCYDLQKITLAKGLCANTVRHLMKDERSLKAVDAAIAFGKGEISRDELDAAADDAFYAYAASATTADTAATYAAAAAASAATAAATAAAGSHAASHAVDAASDDDATRKENQQKTADIVRESLPIEIWEF